MLYHRPSVDGRRRGNLFKESVQIQALLGMASSGLTLQRGKYLLAGHPPPVYSPEA